MSIATPTIRHARPADAPTLTRMLAHAFLDDPVAVWSCPPPGPRLKMLEGMYSLRLRQMLAYEGVWTTPDRCSAALWVPPDGPHGALLQNVALAPSLMHPSVAVRLPMLALGLTGVRRKRSHKPAHWYLSLLGTDPDARGHGYGSAVLRPVLERCDSDRVGAYLESSKERNIDFYARHGFRVTDEYRLPRGPTMWAMWREPVA
jgi:ribosomal protein S18 acetylase RimI-like enzyme